MKPLPARPSRRAPALALMGCLIGGLPAALAGCGGGGTDEALTAVSNSPAADQATPAAPVAAAPPASTPAPTSAAPPAPAATPTPAPTPVPGTAGPPGAEPALIAPPVAGACTTDDPANSEIVMLIGQSNANAGLAIALDRKLTEQNRPHTIGNRYWGGYAIESWMLEDGTRGALYEPTIEAFTIAVDKALRAGKPIAFFSVIWFQGEADVYPMRYPSYESRLRPLLAALRQTVRTQWPTMPEVVFSIAKPYDKEAQFQTAIESIGRAIDNVALDPAMKACAFETRDIPRIDTVHIDNNLDVGSVDQWRVAERAIACARRAARRC